MKNEHVISGLVRKRSEIAGQYQAALKAAEVVKADLAAIDRALELVGYQSNPKDIPTRGKYKMLFGRGECKKLILDVLRNAPATDEEVVEHIIQAKSWTVDKELREDILKRVRDAIQRARNTGAIEQDFGPDGALWQLSESL